MLPVNSSVNHLPSGDHASSNTPPVLYQVDVYQRQGVVTIAQIAGQDIAVGKGVEDECPVSDTFGCRELDGCVQ